MYKYFSAFLLAALFQISGAKAEISRDSIGVENLKGKKLIIHRIAAHDTYYSVARRYNVSPKDIMTYNDSKYLQIGVIIKVPTSKDFNDNQANNRPVQSQPSDPATSNIQENTYSVQPKDNLNRIAEKFGTTVGEIKRINNLSSSNLHLGQVLKVPVKADQVSRGESPKAVVDTTPVKVKPLENTRKPDSGVRKAINVPAPATNAGAYEELVEHTVASNETIYSIATTYHLTIDQLKAKNHLTTSSLNVGQRLLIKGEYGRSPKQASTDPLAGGDTTLKDPSLRGAPSKYGLNQVDEKGTGTWIIDPDLDPTKMLVLHRTAPVGTIIKVTNPMTNRSTFAKVVGKFTENESTRDVIIVMTKAVADSIGALDKRFFCNLTYSGQEVEQ
jgi:peptidoglycan endopeptidase LytF